MRLLGKGELEPDLVAVPVNLLDGFTLVGVAAVSFLLHVVVSTNTPRCAAERRDAGGGDGVGGQSK